MADAYRVDARDLQEFGRNLGRVAERVGADVQRALVQNAEEVKEVAKGIASEHSKTVPGTIHAGPGPNKTAFITAGTPDVRLAALYEIGNKGAKRASRTFKHPVFGKKETWVEQQRHPFLMPARIATRKSTNKRLFRAWDQALRATGLKTKWTKV